LQLAEKKKLNFFFFKKNPQKVSMTTTQDPFADMRPHHDQDHWITKWIRSQMVTPENREKKLAAILGKMKIGADEL